MQSSSTEHVRCGALRAAPPTNTVPVHSSMRVSGAGRRRLAGRVGRRTTGDAVPPPDGRNYSSRTRTLRNLTTPRPYCSAMGPSANCVSSTSTMGNPFSVTRIREPSTRMS